MAPACRYDPAQQRRPFGAAFFVSLPVFVVR